MQQLDEQKKKAATESVINMLQRPGQLEKVEQYKRNIMREKASVEALLKSSMQSLLDGVPLALNHLRSSVTVLKSIESDWKMINNIFADVPALCNGLQEVREENMRHSQYVTAIDNLKHIFTVPESVERTNKWINEAKLLHAHQSLTDLETSRDELLYELHKLPNQSPHDTFMLKAYFSEIEQLSKSMEKQIKLMLSRILNTVRKEPTVIVTPLRIIEREECVDQEALQRHKQTGFLAPGRPKKWREMAFQVFEKAVATRIEGTHVDDRDNNKMWLVRYLELTRQLILEDLRVVKTLCEPCFSASYDIVNRFVKMYHNCLSRHLQELIQNGLEGNEYISLLSWILKVYNGPELMKHPDLSVDTAQLGPLLPDDVLDSLQEQYLKNMDKNYQEWMQNTLNAEKQEWQSKTSPEEREQNGYFCTSTPVIIFEMISQNLQVADTVSPNLTNKALIVSLDRVVDYGKSYREAINEFKNKPFEERSQGLYFTHYMITIVNNCLQMKNYGEKLKEQYLISDQQLSEKFDLMASTYLELRDEAGRYLLEEAFFDLNKHFEALFSAQWLASTTAVETICVTLEDYFQDYNHLCRENFDFVIAEALSIVCRKYATAMLAKKIAFKSYAESSSAAKKVKAELDKLAGFFERFVPHLVEGSEATEAILLAAEVLKCEDPEMLSLDLHRLVDKYPDMTENHLQRLLYLRSDFSRSELKEKIAFALKNAKSGAERVRRPSIFGQIVFVERIISW